MLTSLALKFAESDWVRSGGRFADFVGKPGGGSAGGAGHDQQARDEVIADKVKQRKYDPADLNAMASASRRAVEAGEVPGMRFKPQSDARTETVLATNPGAGYFNVYPQFFGMDGDIRRGVLYHEAGHDVSVVMKVDGSRERLMEPFVADADRRVTFSGRDTSQDFEIFADAYEQVALSDEFPTWDSDQMAILNEVSVVARQMGLPVGPAFEATRGKFSESDWVRNGGRFADFVGQRGGSAGGAGASKEEFEKAVKSGKWHTEAETAALERMTDAEKKKMAEWVEYGSDSFLQPTLRRVNAFGEPDASSPYFIKGAERDAALMSSAIAKTPGLPHDLDTYRGVNISEEGLTKLTPGAIYEDLGFSAVTPHREAAEEFINGTYGRASKDRQPVILRLRFPAGSHLYATNGFSNQSLGPDAKEVHEMLADRNLRARVVSREESSFTSGGRGTAEGMPAWYKPRNREAGSPVTVITLEVE
jgi:hypothetical protein